MLFPLGDTGRLAQSLRILAGMNEVQRQECKAHMLQRLRERFSDEAVRAVFWRLPHVVALTAEG